ncbi:PepSY domain-containing protein [Paracoccus shandongensis]|uniref:PepSY domain-containing protein n=1 Tax=Paracoccus shandongensis TaxID=2816048 RepID=UPI001A8F3FBB|nr:PepSY domain-containing protein [Paracoccus shandongensis]
MRLSLIPATALLTAIALPALAADRCTVPQDQWRPVEELKTELTAKGWTISNVKTEDGCYEVYGKDETGKRVEIFFDPATFQAVGSDE